MWIELTIALFLGCLAGTFTGLAPGIHNNLVTTLLLALLPSLAFLSPLAAAVFIVALAMTHTVIEFIPTVFLNIPEEDSFLALLPAQQFLADGRGYEALTVLVLGSLIGLLCALLITPLYLIMLPFLYSMLTSVIPYILIALSLFIIFREERPHIAALIFILAALLGLLTFRLPLREPLLPLLTGLFGISGLLATHITKIPRQDSPQPLRMLLPHRGEWARALAGSLLAAPLCASLPGIGAGHAATLGSETVPQTNRSFLLLVGSLASAVMALSFVTVFAIGRARSGAAVAIQELLFPFHFTTLTLLLVIVLGSGILAALLALVLGRHAITLLNAVHYRYFSYGIIAFILLITLLISNLMGILVLATATAIGVACIHARVRRIQLMASLIMPAIVFYLTQ